MPRKLTERQRRSKHASKVKARQRWQYALWCKCRTCLVLIATAAMLTIGYGFATGKAQQIYANVMDRTHSQVASAGFAVEKIHISGRHRTAMEDVQDAIGFELGESMLRVDLTETKQRIEQIPTVKHASVGRQFPNSVLISLTEREPVAVWQHKGDLMLIDELGTVMTDLNLHQYNGLPQVVGDHAHKHVGEALALLAAEPQLAAQVQSFIRISDRRWNIRLNSGITIKLPEEQPLSAWENIANMHQEEQLLHRHIHAIDMRTSERMYITLSPNQKPKTLLIPTKDT